MVARGADAVTGACQRGEAALVLVACDAAAAADLGEVRRAVAEGRAVAWGTKERLGAIVAARPVRGKLRAPPGPHDGGPTPEAVGVGVVAITSRTLAEALVLELEAARRAIRHPDFLEGVRAVLVDKDHRPRWHEAFDPQPVPA